MSVLQEHRSMVVAESQRVSFTQTPTARDSRVSDGDLASACENRSCVFFCLLTATERHKMMQKPLENEMACILLCRRNGGVFERCQTSNGFFLSHPARVQYWVGTYHK